MLSLYFFFFWLNNAIVILKQSKKLTFHSRLELLNIFTNPNGTRGE